MLELNDISLHAGDPDLLLLNEISASFRPGTFAAILGPSGSGKSLFLKVVAGLREPVAGAVLWEKRDLAAEEDLAPHEVGYVPQFSIAYDLLSVRENLEAALRLRVAGLTSQENSERLEKILIETGLEAIAERRVSVLSGGQRRRLSLALEIVTSPALLLCDEVTSGLDPKAEDDIVRLMARLAHEDRRIVLSVTHSLRHLDLYDTLVVLFEGHLAYHGPGELLLHYFSLKSAEELFPRLGERSAADWHRSWLKHRDAFPAANQDVEEKAVANGDENEDEDEEKDERTPSAWNQFCVLLARRWRLFFRDRGQLFLQLALLFGFPFLVVIFALNGLPQIKNLNMAAGTNPFEQLVEKSSYLVQATKAGGLVSGLVMFQVILLALTGSNNSAREIAAERNIFEKEKFGGVRPISYIASKALFLVALVLAQSIWMAIFVKAICGFPGDLFAQIAMLALVNGAITAVSLAISSLAKTPDHASLLAVYLVGFQLPLSGAVLALPEWIGQITRPFIASYWSWSGLLQTMRATRLYDVVRDVAQTQLSAYPLCVWVLASHVVFGLAVALIGCKNSRWE